jgi:DNA-directed RNA polymerase specialized sigma24 family protein
VTGKINIRAMDLSIDPSKILEEVEISAIVQREIQALPIDQRGVLLLNKYSVSYEEIAQIVESTPSAVKQQVYRAMLLLRQKLKKLHD